jgi:tripartite-type tricarboxylate transporter receptor subunit TctC
MASKLTGCALILMLAMLSALAGAQTFPGKPIRMIVGFPPGGGTDIVARVIAPRLGEYLGQQVVIENRGGANGILATELAAKAAPDGYTLFLGTLGNLAINPSLYRRLPFDISRDFAPVTQVADVWLVMIVQASFPVKSVNELIAFAKTRPHPINYSTSGTGSALHLAGELFGMVAGIRMMHIPYKGSAPSLTALLSGEVELSVDTILFAQQFVKAGRLRALAVLGAKRSPLLPNVPTVAEWFPDYGVTNWFDCGPCGDTGRYSRSNPERSRCAFSGYQERLQGAEPVGTPEEFGAQGRDGEVGESHPERENPGRLSRVPTARYSTQGEFDLARPRTA